ncbi:hypothetical protein CEUSTIGMA_g3426.t1 [Chlamydomonas eustigma]|uniref:XPA C-terminal domain-containing protein n=1 Tax=Chlamydomonas eustigma TaxID=1157962 RepID=A0A250WYR3_9CHLO|nr:hypothetical protein CEUSTIGMA_g3426.t1 [Chlamydomonas eustigma]|eukprot:GAX75983.1 hypothetical protein CEUSTIGMA_g3426.t1 [Chlamydomonas eustigma]
MEPGGGFIAGCNHCGNLSYNSSWYEAFGVLICESCKNHEQLISKGQAKQVFLLTENDLKRLGTLSKVNPQHKSWRPMQLYLQSQVEEIAQRKHGSVHTLEERRQAKLEAKLDSRLNKQKDHESITDMDERHDGSTDVRPSGPISKMELQMRERLEKEYSSKNEHQCPTENNGKRDMSLDDSECEEI